MLQSTSHHWSRRHAGAATEQMLGRKLGQTEGASSSALASARRCSPAMGPAGYRDELGDALALQSTPIGPGIRTSGTRARVDTDTCTAICHGGDSWPRAAQSLRAHWRRLHVLAKRLPSGDIHKGSLYLEALEERGWAVGACGTDQHKPHHCRQHCRHPPPSSARYHASPSLLHGTVFGSSKHCPTNPLLLHGRKRFRALTTTLSTHSQHSPPSGNDSGSLQHDSAYRRDDPREDALLGHRARAQPQHVWLRARGCQDAEGLGENGWQIAAARALATGVCVRA